MEFAAKKGKIESQRAGCLVVAVFENRKLSAAAQDIDKTSKGYLRDILKRGDLTGKTGQTLLLHNVPGTQAERILLVGCGAQKGMDDARYRKIIISAANALRGLNSRNAIIALTHITVGGRNLSWKALQIAQHIRDRFYQFSQFKKADKLALCSITLLTDERTEVAELQEGIARGTAIANGMDLTKDLGNLPGNVCTPGYLAKQARELAKGVSALTVKILEEVDMKKLKMGAFLSVTQGSRQPAKLIIMHYKGGQAGDAPVVLVGKGITFDSGGVSIKPSPAMDEMKYDMGGAAAVFGAMKTLIELQLPINVVGIVPSCENMPDGNASKPGDVVTSMSGQTIEILNTDAEGRLILCDALTYAARFKPDTVIDIATLTGACVVALGKHATGLLSNEQTLADDLLAAGITSGDRAWQMPLWDEYQEQINTNFADMGNVGGRDAGTITAACFLSRFTKDYTWAHLDIAGTAWHSGAHKGSTGRPVPMLTQYLLDKAGY